MADTGAFMHVSVGGMPKTPTLSQLRGRQLAALLTRHQITPPALEKSRHHRRETTARTFMYVFS